MCLKSPLRGVVPPVSYEEKREDPIGTAGKPTRGAYQSMIRGYKHRSARAMGANFPPYQNLFWDEHLMEEEKIHQAYVARSSSWHRVSEQQGSLLYTTKTRKCKDRIRRRNWLIIQNCFLQQPIKLAHSVCSNEGARVVD